MPPKPLRFWLIVVTTTGWIIQAILAGHLSTEAKIVGTNEHAISPNSGQTKSGKGTNVWDDKVYTPPRKRKKHTPPPPKVPRLTFEWRVLKCAPGGVDTEVSPETIFHENDHFRLAIKTNQQGYLYVINQTEGPDGSVLYGPAQIFPDSKIVGSEAYVRGGDEHILPPRCSPDKEAKCGCRLYFDKIRGRELMIIIFSRELLTDLADNRAGGDLIKQSYVAQLKAKWARQRAQKEISQTSKPNLPPPTGRGSGTLRSMGHERQLEE